MNRLAAILLPLAALTLFAALISGCNTPNPDQPTYVTMSDEPGRSTSTAAELSAQGVEQLLAGNLDEAEKLLRRALEADPACGPAHNNLGFLYLQRKEMYKAAWEFQYASQLMPKNPEPLYNQGCVYEQSGRPGDAMQKYEQAHNLASQNPIYLGNILRIKVRRGDQTTALLSELQTLQKIEYRPDWQTWEQKQILSIQAFLVSQPPQTKQ